MFGLRLGFGLWVGFGLVRLRLGLGLGLQFSLGLGIGDLETVFLRSLVTTWGCAGEGPGGRYRGACYKTVLEEPGGIHWTWFALIPLDFPVYFIAFLRSSFGIHIFS